MACFMRAKVESIVTLCSAARDVATAGTDSAKWGLEEADRRLVVSLETAFGKLGLRINMALPDDMQRVCPAVCFDGAEGTAAHCPVNAICVDGASVGM
jgi:hypothetical protein